MTADVQRELAEIGSLLDRHGYDRRTPARSALIADVQALIAEEGKRAAAAALESYRSWLLSTGLAGAGQISELRTRIAALDPAGADSGEGR